MLLNNIKTNPKLLKLLEESVKWWETVTEEEKEEMIKKQRESWARQDYD